MKTVLRTITALTLVGTSSAYAGVVYNWTTDSLSPLIESATARLEVSNEAWASGRLQNSGLGISAAAPGGLISMTIAIGGLIGDNFTVEGFDCANPPSRWLAFCASAGNTGHFEAGPGAWDYDIQLGQDLGLSARLDIGGLTQLFMGSNYIDYYIDYGTGGSELPCQVNACRATGRWILDRGSLPIPTPSTLALALVGLATATTVTGSRRARPRRPDTH